MEWVLILTLVTKTGVAIHSIPMYNISACKEAGEEWRKMQEVGKSYKYYANWVCKPTR